jgi:hypothetical protein
MVEVALLGQPVGELELPLKTLQMHYSVRPGTHM